MYLECVVFQVQGRSSYKKLGEPHHICVKIGILAKSFPETLLSTDQLVVVQALKPNFVGSTFKPGFTAIMC